MVANRGKSQDMLHVRAGVHKAPHFTSITCTYWVPATGQGPGRGTSRKHRLSWPSSSLGEAILSSHVSLAIS